MRHRFLFVAALLFGAPLHALAAMPDDTLLKDYIGLTKALRANGVEPVYVNWLAIEPMCLGLRTEKNQVAYNQCRFTKATDATFFEADRRSCAIDSVAQYPNTLTTPMPVATIARADGGITTISPPRFSRRDVGAWRDGAYVACMHDLGWRDPASWALGRRDAYDMQASR